MCLQGSGSPARLTLFASSENSSLLPSTPKIRLGPPTELKFWRLHPKGEGNRPVWGSSGEQAGHLTVESLRIQVKENSAQTDMTRNTVAEITYSRTPVSNGFHEEMLVSGC